MPAGGAGRTPHVTGELIARRMAGAHHHLTFVVPRIGELARPGQFVALGVGAETSASLLHRCFWIHRVSPSGTYGGTVELVVDATGPGTRWLAALDPHDEVSILGPLGRPFPLPTEAVSCVLVGGGYGSAPLLWLASLLRDRGCHLEMVLAAPSEDHLFGAVEARRLVDAVTLTTDDGSMGPHRPVSDVLPEVIRRSAAAVVYCCGPRDLLALVSATAETEGVVAQVAVETPMACGVGVCLSCVLPVVGKDRATHLVRACVDGPSFRGDQIRWDCVDSGQVRIPADAVGAPQGYR